MNLLPVTTVLVLIVVALLIAYDIFAVWKGKPGSTISEVIRSVGYGHPMIPFALGVLIGHWFWTG
jgi:hypothetical protein